MLLWDLGLDLCSRTIWSWTIRTLWSWTINNLEEYSKLNMLQDHIWKAYCSRRIQQTCSLSSVHFKNSPGAYLTWKILSVYEWSRTIRFLLSRTISQKRSQQVQGPWTKSGSPTIQQQQLYFHKNLGQHFVNFGQWCSFGPQTCIFELSLALYWPL